MTYLKYLNATCIEKARLNTFADWKFEPPTKDIQDIKCVSNGFCNLSREEAPIPVENDYKGVSFVPNTNFLDEQMFSYEPVEIGGSLLIVCKFAGWKNKEMDLYATK